MDFIAKLIATSVWLVLGLALWVPLLARAVTALIFIYLKAAIERKPAPSFSSANRDVITFYGDGFAWIWSTQDVRANTSGDDKDRWGEFFGAILTAGIFWSPLAYVLWPTGVNDAVPQSEAGEISLRRAFTAAQIDVTEAKDCKIFGPCSRRDPVGSVQIEHVALEEETFFDESKIVLSVRYCSDANYITSNQNVGVYFVDNQGTAFRWPDLLLRDIDPGSCRVFDQKARTEINPSDLERFDNGVFYVSFNHLRYEIPVDRNIR